MSELLDDLPAAHLEYPLRNGVVADWLVLGPLSAPLMDAKIVHNDEARLLALKNYIPDIDEIAQTPAERAPGTATVVAGMTATALWRVVNSDEDGWVDLAQSVATPHTLCAWLYAQCVLRKPVSAAIELTTCGPTQVWINGEQLFSFHELPKHPQQLSFIVTLNEGTNEILMRVANVGVGNVMLMACLRVPGADGVVTLPTLLEPVARRQKLATVMSHAYLSQELYSRSQRIILRWPKDLEMVDALTVRLQSPAGRIYGEANPMIQRGAKVDFGEASQFPDGSYEMLLQPQFTEYYVQDMRVQRRIPLQIRNGKWSHLYYGDQPSRRQEALEDAAGRTGTLIAEIAKSALGKWDSLHHSVIEQTLTQLSPHAVGYERILVALLGWVARMGDLPDFPQEVSWALEESAPLILAQLTDNDGILLLSCHLLAGQLYSQRTFADLQTGEWRQAQAEARVLGWLRCALHYGLPEGESQQSYADAIIALSHLVDLAQSDEVAQLAMAALDKLAYQMALQSFLGAWGGSQDSSNREWSPSARMTPLSGVARLWWGEGAFNSECAATVALACCESYLLPEIIAAVGLDRQSDSWLRRQDARATANGLPQEIMAVEKWPRIQRAAFRTGDYLLTSMQGDWREESSATLWQMTMGPDALIYGNRPACSSCHPAWRQNYWCGNGAPVRVAQWYELLLVGYGHSDAPALDFSHAYFPVALFDEVEFGAGWAMARKGNGYVALTATGGMELVSRGRTAQRELRAAAEAIWLVQMGRVADSGSFGEFAKKIVAQPLSLEKDSAHLTTLRGNHVRFELTGPLNESLWIDDQPQALTDFPHIESIYGGAADLPANSVDIKYQEHHLRLDLSVPEVPSPAVK